MSVSPAWIRRAFLAVGDRRVHYLRAGEGPPVVLVHSSPANAWLLLPEIEHLATRFTVFAFDTPGFGLSAPLPMAEMVVGDLADALADTLQAIGMPPCPMFGSHTGAAIALSFGVRHPERVTGLVLDGVPAFTAEECATLFGEYFRKLPIGDLGGHYAMVWTRFRDQSIWFPWSGRGPQYLNPYDLSAPEATHRWASMYYQAEAHYRPAYRAAIFFSDGALIAAAALRCPAVYTATDTDMLHPHMARLPKLQPGQEIRPIGSSHEAKRALIADSFARFGSRGPAPAGRAAIASSRTVMRQFIDGNAGRQIHVRSCGDRTAPPLLLIHDAPGSAATLEPLILALAQDRFVIAPDLPGAGDSDRFASDSPALRDFAAELADCARDLAVGPVAVHGIGFGASVALAMAQHRPGAVSRLTLQGVLLPDAASRATLAAHYAPPIPIEPDGSHWYRTWLMLRDSLV